MYDPNMSIEKQNEVNRLISIGGEVLTDGQMMEIAKRIGVSKETIVELISECRADWVKAKDLIDDPIDWDANWDERLPPEIGEDVITNGTVIGRSPFVKDCCWVSLMKDGHFYISLNRRMGVVWEVDERTARFYAKIIDGWLP